MWQMVFQAIFRKKHFMAMWTPEKYVKEFDIKILNYILLLLTFYESH